MYKEMYASYSLSWYIADDSYKFDKLCVGISSAIISSTVCGYTQTRQQLNTT